MQRILDWISDWWGALLIGSFVLAMFGGGATAILMKTDAEVTSRNLSKAADMFELQRRVVFYNGINGEYILVIEGACSIKDQKIQLEVTCKNTEDGYVKHFLGLSDNVTYFAEQLHDADVSAYHYRVIFKPQTIVPDVDLRIDTQELMK